MKFECHAGGKSASRCAFKISMNLSNLIRSIFLILILTGCSSHQTRVYYQPILELGWTKEDRHVHGAQVEYFRFACGKSEIYLWPILYDYSITHRKLFGIPYKQKKTTGLRREYRENLYFQYGKKFESNDVFAISVNYLNFQGINYPTPTINKDTSENFHAIDEKRFDRTDVETGEMVVYFFDIPLKENDQILLKFESNDDYCSIKPLQFRRDVRSAAYWDGPIQ